MGGGPIWDIGIWHHHHHIIEHALYYTAHCCLSHYEIMATTQINQLMRANRPPPTDHWLVWPHHDTVLFTCMSWFIWHTTWLYTYTYCYCDRRKGRFDTTQKEHVSLHFVADKTHVSRKGRATVCIRSDDCSHNAMLVGLTSLHMHTAPTRK